MENPIKMDDLGGPPLFLETPIYPTTNQPSTSRGGKMFFLLDFGARLVSRGQQTPYE